MALCVTFTASRLDGAPPELVSGDPIGVDSSLTDHTGGFTATRTAAADMGLPAILVPFDGTQIPHELRVIAFGLPSPDGQLRFDQFNYRVDLWTRDAYFAGHDPAVSLQLDDPLNIAYVSLGSEIVVPATEFGTTGELAGNAMTYDLHFDLLGPLIDAQDEFLFPARLLEGDWVLGFQSEHEIAESGTLRVAGSSADVGPIPLFSRGEIFPRGVLGGQDAENILLRWGISLSAGDELPGDADADNDVDGDDLAAWASRFGGNPLLDAKSDNDNDTDGADLLKIQRMLGVDLTYLPADFDGDHAIGSGDLDQWQASFGIDAGGDANWDGVSAGSDLLIWQRHLVSVVASPQGSLVPTPASGSLAGMAGLCAALATRRRGK